MNPNLLAQFKSEIDKLLQERSNEGLTGTIVEQIGCLPVVHN